MAEILPIRDKPIFNESMKSITVNDSIIQRKSMKKIVRMVLILYA